MAADFLQKFTQIARTDYNAANPTATITQDVAYRAVILGLVFADYGERGERRGSYR
jgi:hypothetical protein